MRNAVAVCLLMMGGVVWAQQSTTNSQLPATPAEVDFFHYMLMSIASPERDPQVAKMNEEAFVRLYGLNQQEAAILHGAGQSFASAMGKFQSDRRAIVSGKASLSSADIDQINSVTATFSQAIVALANQILNSVRPEKAALLRVQGDIVGAATHRN